MADLLQRLIKQQRQWSAAVDSNLPAYFRADGNSYFINTFFRKFLRRGQKVVDVGGGKQPILSAAEKQSLGLTVHGLDISANELASAPAGCYDATICADVTRYRGSSDADLVICQSLLEHVPSTQEAFAAIASMLKPDGLALVFAPSRNAVFARLNLMLPERLKRWLLFTIFPETRSAQGFASYYDRCTPREFEQMAHIVGLDAVERKLFYQSSYFSFFVPLHVLWRLWLVTFKALRGAQAAETFIYAFRKNATPHR